MSKFTQGNTQAARLTAEQVYAIRERYAQKLATQRQLAHDYGVTITTISNIVHGLTWQRVAKVESEEEKATRVAESQRLLKALLDRDTGDAAAFKRMVEQNEPRAPEPQLTQEEYAENIKKLAAESRRRRGLTDEKDEPPKGDSQT